MNFSQKLLWCGSSVLFLGMLLPITASAQSVTADGTLSTTVTSPDNLNFTITNGNQPNGGANLFHSFSQFSVPTGGSATFNLVSTPNISTIFSRVTGGNVSNIDGLIQTTNNSNPVSLFLINPNGIIFGPNASLNIGGSFVGTTANSVIFSDGVKFSASDLTANPLLTVNAPIGLDLPANAAPITVQGTGYGLTVVNSLAPFIRTPSASELRVNPKHTLALVGGDLHLNGATLTAEQGRIELGSVSDAGRINLIPTTSGYMLEYGNQRFGDIQLTQKSLLDVSGVNSGSVQIQGRRLQFTDGSLVLSKNLGNLPSGDIHVQASEAINIIGTTTNAQIRSGIRSEVLGTGKGANVSITTPRLTLQQGAGINNNAFGAGSSGNITIDATAIELSGSSNVNPTGVTSLTTSTRGNQAAGDILVNGNSLVISGGAALSSIAFSAGSSGQVTINNAETTVIGDNFGGLYSNISAITYGTGNSKALTLNTNRLQILNGGAIATTSFLVGRAGDLDINATESIQISDRSRLNNSSINSSVLRPEPLIKQLFNLPNILSADAGNVTVTTPKLILTDGGTVSVTNQGTGNGGNIKVIASTIQLDRQGTIQAQTESGNGGNIDLHADKLLLLRHNSVISATASGNGNGGNIKISAPVIAGFENSDIIANAVRGSGGNINITTQGLFGLKFRPQLTSENDITASSQFGLSGTVNISNLAFTPTAGLIELPSNIDDPSQRIVQGCRTYGKSRFVATGRGGLPEDPSDRRSSNHPWTDIRDPSAFHKATNSTAVSQSETATPPIVEATGWRTNAKGTVDIYATSSVPSTSVFSLSNCAGISTSNL